jgi:hypothetical protein
MRLRRLALLVAGALLVGSCGEDQTFPIDGAWVRGGISGDHSGAIYLLLTQDGDTVVGTACRLSSGHRIYKDVTVTGRYPRISFLVSGCRFDGGIISADQLSGYYECGGERQQWFFERRPPADYESCVNANP